jgi:hypothetical protein
MGILSFSFTSCDSRRAVIIMWSIFGVVLNAVGLLLSAAWDSIDTDDLDDDQLIETVKMYQGSNIDIVERFLYYLGFAISLSVIFGGAIKFDVTTIEGGIFWAAAQLIAIIVLDFVAFAKYGLEYEISDIIFVAFDAVCTGCLLIYPLTVFRSELRQGIMSKETYQQKQYCCCV